MHISMESIGRPSEPEPPKPKEKDKHKEGRKYRGTTPSSGRTGTTSTAINTDKEETGQSASDTDHAGSGRENRAGTKKTTPSAEIPVVSDTGEHFAKRKEVIQDIVKKVARIIYLTVTENNIPTAFISSTLFQIRSRSFTNSPSLELPSQLRLPRLLITHTPSLRLHPSLLPLPFLLLRPPPAHTKPHAPKPAKCNATRHWVSTDSTSLVFLYPAGRQLWAAKLNRQRHPKPTTLTLLSAVTEPCTKVPSTLSETDSYFDSIVPSHRIGCVHNQRYNTHSNFSNAGVLVDNCLECRRRICREGIWY